MKSRRENLMKFFGEKEMVGVDKGSERLAGLEGSQRNRAIVVRDLLTLVISAGDEGRAEDVGAPSPRETLGSFGGVWRARLVGR